MTPRADCELYDLHCHLGLAADGTSVAAAADEAGLGLLSCSLDPVGFATEVERFGIYENVRVAVGMHPWRAGAVSDDPSVLDALDDAISRTRFVGEVGLDFGKRFVADGEAQRVLFEHVLRACVREGGRVLSIHAVRAAGTVLDALEASGCLENSLCVFHWFSGSSEEFVRAVRAGCFFSVGERMLATRRGRAYASQIPLDRLLLETDFPETPEISMVPETLETLGASGIPGIPGADTSGALRPSEASEVGTLGVSELPGAGASEAPASGVPCSLESLRASLLRTLEALEALRGRPLGRRIAETSRSILAERGL